MDPKELLSPIKVEGRRGEFVFDVTAFVIALRKLVEVEMSKLNAVKPTCIRCGEQPFVVPRNVAFGCSTEKWKLTLNRSQGDSAHSELLRFNMAGWRTLQGGENEALCPECLQFVKTVGKDGGA